MGYRTVVLLENDRAHEWSKDPELGDKIMRAASLKGFEGDDRNARGALNFCGSIVEQVHADTQSLVVLDSYEGRTLVTNCWSPNETNEAIELKLLQQLADKMGYTLRRKSQPKD